MKLRKLTLRRKNKRGQLGMGLMMGMIVSLVVFVMLSAFLPVMIQMIGTSKGSNGANCVGYVDPLGTYSYNSSINTDTITCSILNMTTGLYVLSIVFAVISGILTGKIYMSTQEPQQTYNPYGQY